MNSTILSFELGLHQGTAILATRSAKSALTDPGRLTFLPFLSVWLVIDYSKLMDEIRICTKRGFCSTDRIQSLTGLRGKVKLRFEHFRWQLFHYKWQFCTILLSVAFLSIFWSRRDGMGSLSSMVAVAAENVRVMILTEKTLKFRAWNRGDRLKDNKKKKFITHHNTPATRQIS